MRFNQNGTRLAVGLRQGFEIWELDPLVLKVQCTLGSAAGVGIVEPLFRTNLVAFVGGGAAPVESPRKLLFWDDKSAQYVDALLAFNEDIRNVRLRHDRIFVVLESMVFVYPMRTRSSEPLKTVPTIANPRGLLAVSVEKEGDVVFACPGKTTGTVFVENSTRESVRTICAHAEAEGLGFLCLNADGSLLATTDSAGCSVKIFKTATGALHAEFRRGTSAVGNVSLCFSQDSKWLCMSSSSQTVHIFGTEGAVQVSSLSFLSGVMPAALGGNYLNSRWSFAQIHVTDPNTICCFGTSPGTLFVVGSGGSLARYVYDTVNGGKGSLVQEQRFIR